ncbi:GtrA family protein [Massilia sp. DWR3-1-1]|uniref:GtrA family protein n=1 Tax=Massilia sp. DWR3-1-1 TaxID=2804559 RepID=UPI003CF8F111
MIKWSPHSVQFLVYVSGGVLCALIDVGVMTVLLGKGASIVLATSVGFLAGLCVNYLFHAKITFKKMVGLAPLARYLAVVAMNYLLTLACVYAAVWLGAGALAGKLFALPLVAVSGFVLGKRWIFR